MSERDIEEIEIEAFGDHLLNHLGEVSKVYPDPTQEDPPIHILEFQPTDAMPFRTFVTHGISLRPMIIPPEATPYGEPERYIELVMCAPKAWELNDDTLNRPEYSWPLDLLTHLGHYAHKEKRWLGWGHIISNGDSVRPYADNTKLSGCVLLDPISLPEEFCSVEVSERKKINFFAVVPLYHDELQLVRARSPIELLKYMQKASIFDLLDPQRRSICDVCSIPSTEWMEKYPNHQDLAL